MPSWICLITLRRFFNNSEFKAHSEIFFRKFETAYFNFSSSRFSFLFTCSKNTLFKRNFKNFSSERFRDELKVVCSGTSLMKMNLVF